MTPIDLLRLQNPWWDNPRFVLAESNFPKRQAFSPLFQEIVSLRQITAIVGLRRTGKSTLLRQAISQQLLGCPSIRICYFPFEEPALPLSNDLLDEIIQTYLSQILRLAPHSLKETVYLYLDEIQFIPHWQTILKRYYDLTPHLKFIVSGSSSLFIRQEAKESLAGRMFEHYLPPLTFQEYLALNPRGNFSQYLSFGGFPELITLPSPDKKIEYLKNWVIGRVLELDIPKSTGIRHQIDFERLFWSLLPNTGQIISFPKLASDLGIKRPTLFRYLKLLSDSLLINEVLNVSGSFRSTSRLLRKIYPASPNFLSLAPSSPPTGFLAETYAAQVLHSKFGKDLGLFRHRSQEIDFLIPGHKLAIEIMYQNSLHPTDYKFLANFAIQKGFLGLVLTSDHLLSQTIGSIRVLPLSQLETELPKLLK